MSDELVKRLREFAEKIDSMVLDPWFVRYLYNELKLAVTLIRESAARIAFLEKALKQAVELHIGCSCGIEECSKLTPQEIEEGCGDDAEDTVPEEYVYLWNDDKDGLLFRRCPELAAWLKEKE